MKSIVTKFIKPNKRNSIKSFHLVKTDVACLFTAFAAFLISNSNFFSSLSSLSKIFLPKIESGGSISKISDKKTGWQVFHPWSTQIWLVHLANPLLLALFSLISRLLWPFFGKGQINLLMPCPSESKFWLSTNRFGCVQFVLVGSKSFWTGQKS